MPKYSKYLNNVVTKIVMLLDVETIALTEECNSVAMQKAPQKPKDLGRFTLPIQLEIVRWSMH